MIETYRENGIENIMALRGDIPAEGGTVFDYDHASELIYDIKAIDENMCIGEEPAIRKDTWNASASLMTSVTSRKKWMRAVTF